MHFEQQLVSQAPTLLVVPGGRVVELDAPLCSFTIPAA
jgi:hypothetical protein